MTEALKRAVKRRSGSLLAGIKNVRTAEESAMTTTTTANTQPELKEQGGRLLGQIAGYVGHRTIELGLQRGLITELAQHPGGITPEGPTLRSYPGTGSR